MFWNIPISTFSAGLVLKSVSLLVPLHISSRKTWSSFYSTLLKWSLSKAFKNISTKGTFGTRTPSYSKESWKVDPTYSVQLLWSWEVSLNVTWLIHWPWVKSLSIDRCLGRQSWVKCPAQLLSSVVLRQTEFKLDPTKS